MDVVDPILSMCMGIHQMAGNVKANKERCQRVAQRVRALEELVLTIKHRGPGQISAVVENALRELCSTLTFAKSVMIKYSQTKNVKNFLKSGSHKDKFHEVNERLSQNLQVLSGALQIEQVNMMHRVYETFSGQIQNGVDFNGWTPTGTMHPMSSPRPPMPLSSIMPPTAQMPLPGTMAPMPFSSSMAPRPFSSTMAPRPFSSTMAPRPFSSSMAPRPFSSTMAPRPFSSTMAPRPFSSSMAPRPVLHVMAPFPGAPVPLTTLIAQMTFPPQNNSIVGNDVVKNSFNS
ncbi:YLP motif-containing protein 1-like [Cebidichthys violaceus]|uniref:YLP motif-containing protein 1-like n=1 Tax=Cebidichthys violaceus TaxID=271503 RepID=UPI0035CBDA9F